MEKKGITKVIKYTLVLLIVFLFTHTISYFFTVNCINGQYEIKVEGNWVCKIYKDKDEKIDIVGISDAGKEKTILIVPKEIKNIQVGSVTYSLEYCTDKEDTGNLQAVYLIEGVVSYGFSKAHNLKKFIIIDKSYADYANDYIGVDFGLTKVYCPKNVCVDTTGKQIGYEGKYNANVTYYYNYEGAENSGYYWIDNYDYGTKIEYVPENPTREGYEFGGWYKEESCENKWDFEIDTLPSILKGTQGETLYQETKLYAKWIEN